MTIRKTLLPRLVVLCAGIVLVGFLVGSAIVTKKRNVPQQGSSGPLVSSKVKSIEIVSTKIVNEGTPSAALLVEVRNKSNKPVMQIDMVAGDGGVTKNGLTDEDNPIVVIPPHETTTLRMSFGAMTPGAPVVVSAVVYGDWTEEGDADSLKMMRQIREHDKKIKTEKERKP